MKRKTVGPVSVEERVKPTRELMTMEDAFYFRQEEGRKRELEQALRSVAFLLEYGSEIGNEDLDGVAASGLARILRRGGDDVRRLYTQEDIYKSGGDIRRLRGSSPQEGKAK